MSLDKDKGDKTPNANIDTQNRARQKASKSQQAAQQANQQKTQQITQQITRQTQAKKEAQKIFSKIEGLVFEAIREDLKDDIEALVAAHIHENPHLTAKPPEAKQPEAFPQDASHKIRHLIEGYVQEVLEDQAPAIVARTLEEALSPKKPPL